MSGKVYTSKKWLYLKYVVQKKTEEEIAAEAGTTQATINRWLKKHELHKKQR